MKIEVRIVKPGSLVIDEGAKRVFYRALQMWF